RVGHSHEQSRGLYLFGDPVLADFGDDEVVPREPRVEHAEPRLERVQPLHEQCADLLPVRVAQRRDGRVLMPGAPGREIGLEFALDAYGTPGVYPFAGGLRGAASCGTLRGARSGGRI